MDKELKEAIRTLINLTEISRPCHKNCDHDDCKLWDEAAHIKQTTMDRLVKLIHI